MIRNEYEVTWKLFGSWLWENKRKPLRLGFAVLWVLLGLTATWMAVTLQSVLFLVMTVLCLYRAFFRDILAAKRQYAAMEKSYGQRDWLRIITFDEDQATVLEGNISVKYQYSDIVGMKEKGNKVWLLLRDEKVIRLYKDCFVDSGWEECRTLIERKCSNNLVH